MITLILGTNSKCMVQAADELSDLGDITWLWPELIGTIPLHPSLHAEVAERIIAAGRTRHVIVVTHSEVIVLRLRRRRAEGTLSASDLQVFWTSPDGALRQIEVDDEGDIDWWPNGVFSEDYDEVEAICRARRQRGDQKS